MPVDPVPLNPVLLNPVPLDPVPLDPVPLDPVPLNLVPLDPVPLPLAVSGFVSFREAHAVQESEDSRPGTSAGPGTGAGDRWVLGGGGWQGEVGSLCISHAFVFALKVVYGLLMHSNKY